MDPICKLLLLPKSYGQVVGARLHLGMVTLEGFDERLADVVALGAAHRGEAGYEVEHDGEVARVPGSVGLAVVGEPLGVHGRCRPLLDAG